MKTFTNEKAQSAARMVEAITHSTLGNDAKFIYIPHRNTNNPDNADETECAVVCNTSPADLLTSLTVALIQSCAKFGVEPEEILARAPKHIERNDFGQSASAEDMLDAVEDMIKNMTKH